MKKKLWLIVICLWAGAGLMACGSAEAPDVQVTQVAATIFANQTAEALASTPTPTSTPTLTSTTPPTSTPAPTVAEIEESQAGDTLTLDETPTPLPPSTPTPTPAPVPAARVVAGSANLRAGPGANYPVVGESRQGDTLPITGRDASAGWWQVTTGDGQTAWVSADLVESSDAEGVPAVTAPPPPVPPTPSRQWVLVADSAADYPGPIQDRKWWYLWSQGRNNFIWQDMTETPDCYRSPNEMTLAICRDQITVDTCDGGELPRRDCSRGDAALQWKAREGGAYRFEWSSNEVDGDTVLRFYKHLDFAGSQGPGQELAYSAVVEDVIQWELFFWVPQYDTPYHVKVYKLQE